MINVMLNLSIVIDYESSMQKMMRYLFSKHKISPFVIAGSLEAAYSLNWGAREIWGKGGGETLALL